jgi:hypothetical protein
MFAKTAKSKIISARQAAASSVALANRNNVIARAGGLSRTRRPHLVCRWRPKIGGGFECHWDVKPADEVATEGPDQRCISIHGHLFPTLSRIGPRVGRGPATVGRLTLLAAGLNLET